MIFTPDAIAGAVQKALNTPDAVPDGHKAALVTVVDLSGVHVVAAAKIGSNWRIQGTVEHPWTGGLDGGVTIKATW